MAKLMTFLILLFVLALVDLYVYQAVVTVSKDFTSGWKLFIRYGFWIFTAITFGAVLWYAYGDPYRYGSQFRNMVLTGIVMVYFSKLFGVLFVLFDDIQRGIRWATAFFQRGAETNSTGETIPRSEFLAKAAVITATIPFAA